MKFPIYVLAAAAFAMITTEFNIVGVIPLIARDLGVSVPQVGLLVTAFAFTVAISGPFLTILASRLERRALFTGILTISALGNVIAAVAPNYAMLAIGRIISALALPVFWSMASSTASDIAGSERAGSAIATVFTGISIASVVGTPLTTLLASVAGWRTAFAAAAFVCAVMAALIRAVFPKTVPQVPAPGRSSWFLLGQPAFLAHLLLSLVVMTALFTSYTYLADTLERIGGYHAAVIGWTLMGFGVAGIVGNSLAGRALDAGPMRPALLAILFAGVVMMFFVPALANPVTMIVALAFWGAAHAAGFVANHVRVIKAAPDEHRDLAASLNVSVFNTGIGLGAIVGGQVIDRAGLAATGPSAGAISLLALFLGLLIVRLTKDSPQVLASGRA